MTVLGFEQEKESKLYHHPCFSNSNNKLIDFIGKNSIPLPDDDESRIKEKVLDELTPDHLKAKDGLDRLLAYLDKHLKKDDLADEWAKFNEFDDFKRGENMKIDEYRIF